MDCSWILLVFLLLLQFSGHSSVTVREGADVTLSCESVTPDQFECEQTTWDFTGVSGRTDLYIFGQKQRVSSGVSLSEDCSLVLESVSEKQVGVYRCRQYDEKFQQSGDTLISLSVVTLSEDRDDDRVTLSCSVRTFGVCRHSVKWTNKGKEVNKDHKELQTSHSACYSTVAFLDPDQSSQFDQTLKCEVTDENKQKLTFSPPSAEINPETSSDQTGQTDTGTLVVISVCVALAAVIPVVFIVWWRKTVKNKEETGPGPGPDSNESVTYSAVKISPAAANAQPEVIP